MPVDTDDTHSDSGRLGREGITEDDALRGATGRECGAQSTDRHRPLAGYAHVVLPVWHCGCNALCEIFWAPTAKNKSSSHSCEYAAPYSRNHAIINKLLQRRECRPERIQVKPLVSIVSSLEGEPAGQSYRPGSSPSAPFRNAIHMPGEGQPAM